MFERRWLLTPLLGAALLFGACSGDDDSDDKDPTGTAGSSGTTSSSASPSASAPGTSSTSPSASPAGSPAGGTDTPASPTVLTSSRTPSLDAEFAENPCAVLSDEEIEAAAGGAVISAQGIADRVQPFCRWLLSPSGQDEPAIIDMVIASIGNTSLFNNPTATKVDVAGLGDAAYVVRITGQTAAGTFELWVREGTKTLQIQFQVLDPRFTTQVDFRNAFNVRAQAIAEEIARLALERI